MCVSVMIDVSFQQENCTVRLIFMVSYKCFSRIVMQYELCIIAHNIHQTIHILYLQFSSLANRQETMLLMSSGYVSMTTISAQLVSMVTQAILK